MIMRDFLYKNVFRKIAFQIDPELVHNLAIIFMRTSSYIPFVKDFFSFIYGVEKSFDYLGLRFKNPIGLAAGFDKNAEVFDFIEALGFGFCEVGSVTLKPQKGNPKPRIFRIVDEEAIINYIGLESKGVYYVAKNLEKKRRKTKIPIGINISKNNDVEGKDAILNIFECFMILKDLGDFFVFNISCPNVANTKEIKINVKDYLEAIIDKVLSTNNKKPIFIKISPDIDDLDLEKIIMTCEKCKVGLITTNTTKRRDIIETKDFDSIKGGLSGKPLSDLSFNILKKIRFYSSNIPVISCGGIFEKNDIEKRANLGVKLFEVYTSFIYEGPQIVRKLVL